MELQVQNFEDEAIEPRATGLRLWVDSFLLMENRRKRIMEHAVETGILKGFRFYV